MRRLLAAFAICVAAAPAWAQTPSVTEVHVGVLAPFSGEFEEFGLRALAAVSLAAPEGFSVVPYDTAGDPAAAYAAAAARGAVALFGPIGDHETASVLDVALDEGPVLLALNGAFDLRSTGPRVFAARTSVADEARAAVDVVATEDPDARVAVAWPDDAYGRAAATAFVAEAVARGIDVVALAPYATDESDFSDVLAMLGGARMMRLRIPHDPWRQGPQTALGDGGRSRRPDWVFVADFGASVADMLPFFAFDGWINDLAGRSVQFVGTGGWMDGALAASDSAPLAAGARVVRTFAPDDNSGSTQAFVDAWVERYGSEPVEFDAQVFDVAQLVFDAIRRGATTPSRLTAALDDSTDANGVCGRSAFVDRRIIRALGVWEVDAGGWAVPIGTWSPEGL
jgi:ABC-type branched-subunit amino acid transport system substrate-binding protein